MCWGSGSIFVLGRKGDLIDPAKIVMRTLVSREHQVFFRIAVANMLYDICDFHHLFLGTFFL